MPDALRLQFLRLFNGACDAAVRRDDVPVEQHPVMSGYGHGRYQCLFQPLPFGLDAFRVAAFLVGVYIVNQDAVRIMKTSYGIDMEADGQYSKLIRDIPTPDIVISMGCNVGCPFIDRPFDDNWGLEDPTGKNDEAFKLVIEEIRKKILELKKNAS